jgi:hypothetical protein
MKTPPTPTLRSRIALAAVMAAAIGGATLATAAVLTSDTTPVAAAAVPAVDGPTTVPPIEADAETGEAVGGAAAEGRVGPPAGAPLAVSRSSVVDCLGEQWEPTDEEIVQANLESEALAAVLGAAGLEHTVTTNEFGFMSVDWDYDDGVAQATVNSFYRDLYPEEYAGEQLPDEELARIREENAGLIVRLDEAGIDYEVVSEDGGFEWVEWNFEDVDAPAVVDAYYRELYPSVEGECEGGGEVDWEPSQEEVDMANAESHKLIDAFDAAGVDYTTETDDVGFVILEWDWDDAEPQAVAEGVWIVENEARAAEIGADLDHLAAAFDAAGVNYVREGHDECETIIFDVHDDAVLSLVASAR